MMMGNKSDEQLADHNASGGESEIVYACKEGRPVKMAEQVATVDLLEADSIVHNFGSHAVLTDIYIKCETGKVTGLLGRNGHGKSTLLKVLYGTLQPSLKSVRLNGQPIGPAYLVPGLIGYLPQNNFCPKDIRLKQVFEDFELDYGAFEKTFPAFAAQYNSRVKNLSGGQQRLAETYVLLAGKARFVLLDEPFTHLSPLMVDQVKELIRETRRSKGILITDHLYQHVISMSDNLYVLSAGKLTPVHSQEELQVLGYTRR
jgi:ABC-type multidrug transport system ATPase subunit